MAERRSLQRNAADPEQVKYADRKARQAEERGQRAFAWLLSTEQGREALRYMFTWRPTDQTVFDHSGSQMYFKEGERNILLRLKAECVAADETNYELLEREGRALRRGLERESAAVQTKAITEENAE